MRTAVGGEQLDARWVLLNQLYRLYRLYRCQLARYKLGHGDYVFKNGHLTYVARI